MEVKGPVGSLMKVILYATRRSKYLMQRLQEYPNISKLLHIEEGYNNEKIWKYPSIAILMHNGLVFANSDLDVILLEEEKHYIGQQNFKISEEANKCLTPIILYPLSRIVIKFLPLGLLHLDCLWCSAIYN